MPKINRAALLRVCNLLKPALSGADHLPVLKMIQFHDGYATSFNDVSAISVPTDASFERCVPGELLMKQLASLTGEEIVWSFDEKTSKLVLKCERSTLTLPTLPWADMPFELPDEQGSHFGIDKQMRDAIVVCLRGAGTEKARPAMLGVTVTQDRDGTATLWSTDALTCSKHVTQMPISLPAKVPVMLPTFFAEQLIKLYDEFGKDTKNVTVCVLPDCLQFTVGHTVLYSRTIVDLTPLDFEKVMDAHIPLGTPTYMEIPAAFHAAIDRSIAMFDKESKTMKCTYEPKEGVLHLNTDTARGVAEDDFEWRTGREISCMVDPSLIQRGLKSCGRLGFNPKGVVMSNANCTFVHLIALSTK